MYLLYMEHGDPVVSVPEHSKQSIDHHDPVLSEPVDGLSPSNPSFNLPSLQSPSTPRSFKARGSPNASPSYFDKTALKKSPGSQSPGGHDRSLTPKLHKRTSLSSLKGAGGATPSRSPVMQRFSPHFASSPTTGLAARSSLPPPAEEASKAPLTAVTVARAFFRNDLEAKHSSYESATNAQTVIILQDDCYGHRYSRPRTSRAGLDTIVERPERIHASVLGIACAYVRLGGHHADGVAAPRFHSDPSSMYPAPFQIHRTARKVSLRSPAVTAIHGVDWMNELSAMCDSAESKLALNGKELTRLAGVEQANRSVPVERAKLHEGDLYLCSGSLNALQGALGGVCEAVDMVFNEKRTKRAFVCIRPPGHHCSADMPSGFCWLNNVHVGIGHASISHGLTHAAIIDFDLHHGDGSQAITWAHNARVASLPKNTSMSKKTAIGYFSLHDINSYPCEMGDEEKIRSASLCIENAHGQSIWNVHLQAWKTEDEFWTLYEDKYLIVLAKARAFLRAYSDKLRQSPTHPKPRAAIFLSAGFDASEWESPGMQRHQVNVPTSFYARFTRDIVSMAEEDALGVDGRVVSVLEGGYSNRALMSGVLSHISGLSSSTSIRKPFTCAEELAHEMGRGMENLNMDGHVTHQSPDPQNDVVECFDPKWWSLADIEELETLANPSPTAAASKKQRNDSRSTYTSVTQSYTAKIVPPSSTRRSLSAAGPNPESDSPFVSRAPSPPTPAVHWATATNELSKLLVPSDRETQSCKPEDLNAEATRARRDRQSAVGLSADGPSIDRQGMQLREKKPKVSSSIMQGDEEKKAGSKTHRRKTIADVNLLAQPVENNPMLLNAEVEDHFRRPARRRSSAASNSTSHATQVSTDSLTDLQMKGNRLPMKKTRAPVNPRPEPSKSKAVRRQPALSEVQTAPKSSDHSAAAVPEHSKNPLSVNNELKNQDVDQLSSSMKKMSIKLNVPNKDEYEARHVKPKLPRGRSARSSTKAGKVTSPDKKANTLGKAACIKSVPKEHGDLNQSLQSAKNEDGHKITSRRTSLQTENIKQCAPSSSSEDVTPSLGLLTEPPSSMHTAQAGPRPGPSLLSLSSPASKVPSTPTTIKRSQQELPVFTSTSPLSFALPAVVTSNIDQKMNTDGDTTVFTEVHPQASSAQSSSVTPDLPGRFDVPGADQAAKTQSPSQTNAKVEDATSIWDIPDTPQVRKL